MDQDTVGNLRDGATYRATAYSIVIKNPDGTTRQTVDANDVRSIERRDSSVHVRLKRGPAVVLDAATLDDAGRLVERLRPSVAAQDRPRRGGTVGTIAKYGCVLPLIVVGGLVVLAIVVLAIAVGGDGDSIGGDDVHVALAEGSSGTVTSAGETARVTINRIIDNAASTNQFAQPAQGTRFWVVDVLVENVDDDEIYAGDWKIRTSDNSEFSRTFAAGLEAIGQNYALVQNLTPGGRTQGIVVFQIPSNVSVTFLRYEGNPFATGDLYFDAR